MQNMVSFLGWNEPRWILLFPLPEAEMTQSLHVSWSFICFMVEAQHPATAPGTSWGQESESKFKNQTFFNYRGPKNRPQTSKLKDVYSARCSLGISLFFPEICLLVSLVTPPGRSKCT